MSKLGHNLRQTGDIILRPRLTEKASAGAKAPRPVYTFEVTALANKATVRQAIKKLYQVDSVRVNIVNLPAKQKLIRGKMGQVSATRKALVYLKPGDKIE